MELSTKENGKSILILDKEKDSRYGLMGQCTRGGGKIIRLMEGVDLYMQMVIYMMDSGKTIRLMDMEYTSNKVGSNTQAIGLRTSNMGREKKHGLMELLMMENILMERRMGLESLYGLMEALMKDNFMIIT